jgi:hypothetical protein
MRSLRAFPKDCSPLGVSSAFRKLYHSSIRKTKGSAGMHYLSAEKIGCKRELFEVLGKQHEPVWMQWLSLSFGLLTFFAWPRTITLDEIGISQRSLFGIPRTIPYNQVEYISYEPKEQTTLVVGSVTTISVLRKTSLLYGPERFTHLPENNSYLCPAGQQLNFVGLNVRNRTHTHIGSRTRCGACSQKAQCTTGQYKYLAIHIHGPARQRARELARTPAFANFHLPHCRT